LTFLDSSALIALLRDEPEAARVDKLLRSERCSMPLTNAAEVIDVCLRAYGFEDEALYNVLLPLFDSLIEIVAPTLALAWRAAEIRRRHYHGRTQPVSLADCLLVASAGSGDRVATKDEAALAVARAEGVGVLVLA
jgi:predicted nucleic acid-binding protein